MPLSINNARANDSCGRYFFFFGYCQGNLTGNSFFLSCRIRFPMYIGRLSVLFGFGYTFSFFRFPSFSECITFRKRYSSLFSSPTIKAGCPDFAYTRKCGNFSFFVFYSYIPYNLPREDTVPSGLFRFSVRTSPRHRIRRHEASAACPFHRRRRSSTCRDIPPGNSRTIPDSLR